MTIYTRVTHNQRPAYQDILIYQGATFSNEISVKNVDGTPFDLTNFSARGKIKKTEFSESDVDLTCTITNASGGILTISLTSTETTALYTANRAQTWSRYDVEIFLESFGSATVYRILQGQVLIEPEITT